MDGLSVVWKELLPCDPQNAKHPSGSAFKKLGCRYDRKPGWYVSVEDCDGVKYLINATPFMRHRDAEMAKNGLLHKGLGTVEKLVDAGAEEVLRTMYESLAW
jgi:hypothetical protein